MKKIYFICITLIVLIISITAVNAGFFDFGKPDEKIIYINSQDSNMSGKVHIIEYTVIITIRIMKVEQVMIF